MTPLYQPEGGTLVGPSDKILIIAPHPDDEVISCGGLIAKYPGQVDVLCINSSGVAYSPGESAEKIADVRIEEFNRVMDLAGVDNRWIMKIWGTPPMFKQINDHFHDYIQMVDLSAYDLIFLPHRFDGHREHRYVANHLVPQMMRQYDLKPTLLVVEYEVWASMEGPNYYEDISEYVSKKQKMIDAYESRGKSRYASRVLGLNHYRGLISDHEYSEAFRVLRVQDYLKRVDDKSWDK